MAPTRIYVKAAARADREIAVHGLVAHHRRRPGRQHPARAAGGTEVVLERSAWARDPVFEWLQRAGPRRRRGNVPRVQLRHRHDRPRARAAMPIAPSPSAGRRASRRWSSAKYARARAESSSLERAPRAPRRVVILISGRGSNMRALVERSRDPAMGYRGGRRCSPTSRTPRGLRWRATSVSRRRALVRRRLGASRRLRRRSSPPRSSEYAPSLIVLAGFMRILSAGVRRALRRANS